MARATERLATAGPAAFTALDDAPALTPVRDQSTWGRVLRRLRRERKVLVGLVIIAVLAFLAVFGSLVAPYDPDADDFGILQPPSIEHPFGTDSFGRDLFSRVIIGTRVSFSVGVLAAGSALVVGVLLGITAGYYGRWIDSVISRGLDLLWAFPEIILAVALVAIFGAGFHNVIIAISVAFFDDIYSRDAARLAQLRAAAPSARSIEAALTR